MFKLKKYSSLLWAFFKTSFMADLEYRTNFIVRVITDVIWYATQLSVFEVIYKHTTQLGEWNVDNTRVFMGVLFCVDAVYMILFWESLDGLSQRVRNGELDMLFTKPVNSQFMVSTKKLSSSYVINFMIAFSWLIYAIAKMPGEFNYYQLLWLILLIPCAVLITYSCRFFFASCSIIFVNSENLNYIWYQFYRMGSRPNSIYPVWLRYILLSIVPVGFIVSIPAEVILHQERAWKVIPMVLVTSLFLFLTSAFWRWALKHYSSASS